MMIREGEESLDSVTTFDQTAAGRRKHVGPQQGSLRAVIRLSGLLMCGSALVVLVLGTVRRGDSNGSVLAQEAAQTRGFLQVHQRSEEGNQRFRSALNSKKALISALSGAVARVSGAVARDIALEEKPPHYIDGSTSAPYSQRSLISVLLDAVDRDIVSRSTGINLHTKVTSLVTVPKAVHVLAPRRDRPSEKALTQHLDGGTGVREVTAMEKNTSSVLFLGDNGPGNPLKIQVYCREFEEKKNPTAGVMCAENDCKQLRGNVGCKFMNELGYCYGRRGQKYCAKNADDESCFTSPPAPPAYLKAPACAPQAPGNQAGTGKKGGTVVQDSKDLEDSSGRQSGSGRALDDALKLNKYCERYTLRRRSSDLQNCRQQDCEQARSSAGCTYMNDEGFCWRGVAGQQACEQKPDDSRCVASLPPGKEPPYLQSFRCSDMRAEKKPKRQGGKQDPGEGKEEKKPKRQGGKQDRAGGREGGSSSPSVSNDQGSTPLKINRSCQQFTYRRRLRYQRKCGRDDCEQIGRKGCKYMNKDGFCYTSRGQRFCAANSEDERCLTKVPNSLHDKCSRGQGGPRFRGSRYRYRHRHRHRGSRYRRRRRRRHRHRHRGSRYRRRRRHRHRHRHRGSRYRRRRRHRHRHRHRDREHRDRNRDRDRRKKDRKDRNMKREDIFKLNKYCERYTLRRRSSDLQNCRQQDCEQARSSAGCTYMNDEGFCWRGAAGQQACEQKPDDSRCVASLPPGKEPPYLQSFRCSDMRAEKKPKRQGGKQDRGRRGEGGSSSPSVSNDQGSTPLKINRSCQQYTYRRRLRYQHRCGRDDCEQIGRKGCKYMNKDGFCYTSRGQRFCAANSEDERCLTKVPNSLHDKCSKTRSISLPTLPNPSSLGLRPGFRGRFYYTRRRMKHSPNFSSLRPDAQQTSHTIDYSSVADFQIVARGFPRNYFAATWQGVIKVERAGMYTFSTVSEAGSHVWVDDKIVVDNGGIHSIAKASSSVGLGRGYHALRADFFKNDGSAMMVVLWKGPDTLGEEEALSGYHVRSSVPPVGAASTGDPAPGADASRGARGVGEQGNPDQEGKGKDVDGGGKSGTAREPTPGGEESPKGKGAPNSGNGKDGSESGPSSTEPLPKPDSVGMKAGFLGQLYFMGSSMQAMPNVATLVPDFSYVAQGIALKNRQELIGINPDGMKPDFLAGIWSGVVSVNTPGSYTFYLKSSDGSQLSIDGDRVVSSEMPNVGKEVIGNVQMGRGYHMLQVKWFKNDGEAEIVVKWSGPDTMAKKEPLKGFHFSSVFEAHKDVGDAESNTPSGDTSSDQASGLPGHANAGKKTNSNNGHAGQGGNGGTAEEGSVHGTAVPGAGNDNEHGPAGTGRVGSGNDRGQISWDIPENGNSDDSDTEKQRSPDIPEVDKKALGLPLPIPQAASHPLPTIPYDSPARYNKNPEGEGPTEDPFHARQEKRLAQEEKIDKAKVFDDLIKQNPSAGEVFLQCPLPLNKSPVFNPPFLRHSKPSSPLPLRALSFIKIQRGIVTELQHQAVQAAADVINRASNSLGLGGELETPPPLHAPTNLHPHYNV